MKIRIPERVRTHIVQSRDYEAWEAGKGCLATDRALFAVLRGAETRADHSVHLDLDDAALVTLHQWALDLTYQRGLDETERRANIRSARSVIRQIDPKA